MQTQWLLMGECEWIVKLHRPFSEQQDCHTSLLEAAEVLTWIGAACRELPDANGLGFCVPSVARNNRANCGLGVTYTCSKVMPADSKDSAVCWHEMFRNPVIVKGYPIPTRAYSEHGLETSLLMMSTLGRVSSAQSFRGKLVLKGWNTILAPLERIGSSIRWHFLVNQKR